MEMVDILNRYYQLQNIYGDPNLDPIISGGEMVNPSICFLFMNPTGRNIASRKEWKSIKAPWIGTKNIWHMFKELNILDAVIYTEILKKHPTDWDYKFSEEVYENIKSKGIYISNLAKCTQPDARALPNSIFKEYLDLLLEELEIVNPQKVVTFGNQVSSIFLNTKVSVSKSRKKIFGIKGMKVMPTFYPVGQGMRNIGLAIEDIEWFRKEV